MFRLKPHRGMALMTILALVSILGVLTGVVGHQASLSLSQNRDLNERETAHFLAYGGLQRALIRLRLDPGYKGGANKALPGTSLGKYDLEVIENTSATKPKPTPVGVELPPLTKMVISTGKVSDNSRTLVGIIGSQAGGPGFGGLAEDKVIISGGLVDAFDIAGGDFSEAALKKVSGAAQIGTASGITVIQEKPSDATPALVDGVVASEAVDGDVSTVESGVYSLDATATLGGETTLDSAPSLDIIAPVTYLGGPVINSGGSTQRTLSPGHYQDLHLFEAAEVTLEPGDYYFSGNVELFGQSKIKVNGPVKIHVNQLFAMRDDSKLNHESDPRDVELIATGDMTSTYAWLPYSANLTHTKPWNPSGSNVQVGLADESQLWAKVRAPNAYTFVSGSIYGDAQAKQLQVWGDATRHSGAIHYFKQMGATAAPSTPSNFVYDTIWVAR